jgi:hypothetical protein
VAGSACSCSRGFGKIREMYAKEYEEKTLKIQKRVVNALPVKRVLQILKHLLLSGEEFINSV